MRKGGSSGSKSSPGQQGLKLPGEVLSADDVRALIAACGIGLAGNRNRALVATMFGAGLRVSEALALRPSDVDLQNGLVTVKQGKGNKSRRVAIDRGADAYLMHGSTPASASG